MPEHECWQASVRVWRDTIRLRELERHLSVGDQVLAVSLVNNCGTTREGEVDLVRPLKAGFETDPNSTTQPALDPSSKLDLAARSKLTLAVPISDLAAA